MDTALITLSYITSEALSPMMVAFKGMRTCEHKDIIRSSVYYLGNLYSHIT